MRHNTLEDGFYGWLDKLFANPSFATLLDFEQFDVPKKVTTQFSSREVRFAPHAFLNHDRLLARSGTRALLSASLSTECNTGPLRMEFPCGHSEVSRFESDLFVNLGHDWRYC